MQQFTRVEQTFVEFVSKHHWKVKILQETLQICLVVVQKQKKQNRLLFDGRFLPQSENFPPKCLLFDDNEFLLNLSNKIAILGKLTRVNFQHFNAWQPLWKLLQLPNKRADPTSYSKTLAFLQANDTPPCTVHYIAGSFQNSQQVIWYASKSSEKKLQLEAFTKSNFTLGFRIRKHRITKKKMSNDPGFASQPPFCASKFEHNRSAAVSVQLLALNQAHYLGVLTLKELQHLSMQLGLLTGALWLDYDTKGHVRHITFCDWETTFHWEISCSDKVKQDQTWYNFFNFLWTRRRPKVTQEKKKLLSTVVGRLQLFCPKGLTKNPFKNCLDSLERATKKYTLLVYSEDDFAIHATKLHFCNYVSVAQEKNFRGVHLKCLAGNELVALVTAEMQIVNLGSYFGGAEILPSDLPYCTIEHDIGNFKHQKKYNEKTTLLACLKERSVFLAKELVNIWHQLGNEFMTKFNFDIYSAPYTSLSAMAFRCVWLKYNTLGGPFLQGPEKIKKFYEELLRNHSHGGFLWSCRDRVNADEPLWPETPDAKACSLVEYDLSSSYGYAAASMQAPGGFCVGYFETADGVLERTDALSRHKSFEFLAVYYTLKQMQLSGKTLLHVYSNFHVLGIFQIGPYPLDLAVVVEGGSLELFQFDGEFAHGCKKCDNLDRFVGNKSKEKVLDDTAKRDKFLRDWADSVKAAHGGVGLVNYTVITDCHDTEYSKSALWTFYESDDLLFPLVRDYPVAKQISKDDILNCNDNLTYIAFVRGHTKSTQKALFVKKGVRFERSAETEDQDLLVTKDYLEFLTARHNFTITKVSACLFFKKCKVFPEIYRQLLNWRATAATPAQAKFVKNVVNYSCGFFGYNAEKNAQSSLPTCRLSTKLSKKFDISRTQVSRCGSVGDRDFILTKLYKKPPNPLFKCKKSSSPLPLFVSVIEFGKLRLAQIFTFVESNVSPDTVRHLYSNVDNIIFALTTPTLQDAFQNKDVWLEEFDRYFGTGPGQLKQEWQVTKSQRWKFVSPMIQNWALLTDDPESERHKNSALSHISTEESYKLSCDMLDRVPTAISQTRRIDKVATADVHQQFFNFVPAQC